MTPEAATLAALNTHLLAHVPLNWESNGDPVQWEVDGETLTWTYPMLGDLPVLWREKDSVRPPEYLMVDHLPNISTRPMLDSARQDLSGIYQLTLARAKGQHEIVYREQAAQILAHFMDAVTLTADGKTITITQATAGQGRADGTRWMIPISIYYRLDA